MMSLCKEMSNGQESPKLGIELNAEKKITFKNFCLEMELYSLDLSTAGIFVILVV